MLVSVAASIVWAAAHRFNHPPEIHTGIMLLVAAITCAGNLGIALWLMRSKGGLGVKSVITDLFSDALVLLSVFMLLASAFASLRDATITLVNFPLGLIGGVVGALLTPGGLSVAGLVGFVTLLGIISRNGIMLVAHKQLLDAESPQDDPIARILRASEERLLPILMTAGAAGLGLLPLALAFNSSGSELEAPMALIVVLGLITSTALNMLVIPTIYVWLERRRARPVSA